MPAATPVTTPDELTVDIDVLLLLQLPALVASLNVVAEEVHTIVVPVMIAGAAFTVIVADV